MTTTQQIRHLYGRAGFGWSPKEWTLAKTASLSDALERLFAPNQIQVLQTPPIAQVSRNMNGEQKKEVRTLQRKSLNKQKAAWIGRMANPQENTLLERMSLFWHGHFACISQRPLLAVQQINTIRQHALGSFRHLLLAIAKDAAMIRFLNNQQNRKENPNENFAREVLELFTIGRGNYTEQDIKEAARAFTGWASNNRGEFVFRKWAHDEGDKTFFGKTGNWNGDDIIDLILERKETALFLTRKIYRYFINPKVDEDRVYQLAKSFYQSNYDIGNLMRQIFESEWFYATENIGVKIKSPVDLMTGIIRTLDADFPSPSPLIRLQRLLGQELFNPPNVAGWKGNQNWIDHATLMMRLNVANHFVSLSRKEQGKYRTEAVEEMMQEMKQENFSNEGKVYLTFEPIVKALADKDADEIFEELSEYLLSTKPSLLRNDIEPFVLKKSRSQYVQSMMLRLMSLPEYQMC
ncbi:MAG: DUF1800 domain-containing protein [Bacteroidota bacterium]